LQHEPKRHADQKIPAALKKGEEEKELRKMEDLEAKHQRDVADIKKKLQVKIDSEMELRKEVKQLKLEVEKQLSGEVERCLKRQDLEAEHQKEVAKSKEEPQDKIASESRLDKELKQLRLHVWKQRSGQLEKGLKLQGPETKYQRELANIEKRHQDKIASEFKLEEELKQLRLKAGEQLVVDIERTRTRQDLDPEQFHREMERIKQELQSKTASESKLENEVAKLRLEADKLQLVDIGRSRKQQVLDPEQHHKEMETIKKELQEKITSESKLKNVVDQFKVVEDDLRRKVKTNEKQHRDSLERASILQQQVEKSKKEAEQQRREFDTIRKHYKDSHERASILQKQAEESKKEAEQQRREFETIGKQQGDLLERAASFEQQVNQLKREAEEYRSREEAHKKTISETRDNLKNKQIAHDKLWVEIDTLKGVVTDLKGKLQSLQRVNESFRAGKPAEDILKKELAKKDQTITELTNKISEQDRRVGIAQVEGMKMMEMRHIQQLQFLEDKAVQEIFEVEIEAR
jgi:hypothetical protein